MALIKESEHLRIPFKDLEVATKNFTTLIGKGGYGNVYKGELSLSGKLTTVAVKRLDAIASNQGFKEFLTEIQLLSRYKHPNLVSLLGFCHEGNEKILVYEHAEHGSLDKFLSMKAPLTCKQKINICIDAACGLDYLHNHVAENHRVIHRDIKSANILLDHNWKAMISDLGLSKIGLANGNDTFLITNACGTHGYCDPIYMDTGVLTKESDVYSLGVVLFEVLCGRFCIINVHDDRRFLAPLARRYYEKGKLHEIIDPVMKEHLPPDSLEMILEIAHQCLCNNREERPSIGLVVEKLKEVAEGLEMNIHYPKHQLSSFWYQEEELGVFGLNGHNESLVRRLTHETEMFVPIVGEEGSGKTTLARAVYMNRKTKENFEFQSWISVTEEYSAERIIPIIFRSMHMVNGRRYLIVVDGVGSYDVLQDLKNSFPDEKNGSKVIFTSRAIPEKMELKPHIMKKLNDEESWKMFVNKAGKEKEADQIAATLKRKILTICNGSPQNIVLMAGLLSNNEIRRWSSVIDDGRCPNDVLRICYNNLTIPKDDNSKLCLLYMALFPKDYDIPVRRLLRLWLTEGFVRREHKDQFPEDLAQRCFEKLVGRNIIQITKLRSDNSPRRCRLVSVFHSFLLPKAQDIGMFYIQRDSENFEHASAPFGVERLVQHISTPDAFAHQQAQVEVDPPLLWSYLSFNFQPKDISEKQAGMVLSRIITSDFALLRVLDLEGVYKMSLPDKLGHLRLLRYLGLRWTFLENLPKSVGDLSYLETLDVKHTRVYSLPNSIWKLKRLRHLNLNNVRLSMPPKSSSSLVTLWGLVLDEKISVTQGLGKLLELRELGIKFSLDKSQSVLLDWIVKLVELQSLRLTSVNVMGQPSDLVLKPLTSLNKLSHLNLCGRLQKLPEFPPTIKVLTLSLSKLDRDPMETLGQLPCLIVLRLLGESYTGTRMVCRRGGYKKLGVLKLWKLENLEEWVVEEEAMERLREVEIRRCHRLSNIPCEILQKGLEELILTDMPVEFVAEIKKRKPKYTSLTIK